MNKKILFFSVTVLLLLFIPFMSASLDSLGVFKQGDTVRISQVCSDATYINISSVSYPNSTSAVSNIEMTSSGSGEYYYDFNLTNTAGRYDVRGVSDGCENTFATYFEVTPSGSMMNEGDSLVLFGSLLIMIILSSVFLYLASKSESVTAKVALYSVSFIGYLMAVLYSVVTIQQILFGFDSIIDGIETFLFIGKIGVFIGFIVLMIIVFLVMLKAWKIKRGFDD